MNVLLTDQNFIIYAIKKYNNPTCKSDKEFFEDLSRIKYIKRLLKRFFDKKILKERLILNHLIVLFNIFDVESAIKILFFKIDKKLWPLLKTFLVYLDRMPDKIVGVKEKPIVSSDIPIDINVAKILRQL